MIELNSNVAEAKNSNQAMQTEKFNSPIFGEIRTIIFNEDKNEPWFVLNEICDILGYKNPRDVKAKHLREKDCKEVSPEMRRTPELSFLWKSGFDNNNKTLINENGLYRLIMRSKKPNAELFQDWVTSEVLPMIRKTGAYLTKSTAEALASGDIAAQRDFIKMYLTTLDDLEKKNQMLQQATTKIEEDRPKVEFHDAVHDSTNLMTIGEFSKVVSIGEKTLFKMLRDEKIFYYDKKINLPYQEYINRGYFKVVEGVYNGKNGEKKTYLTTKITGSGQTWLLEEKINR